jgi:chemosensory pili system protein ChpC
MEDNYLDFIPSMLIPLKQHYLLLPNATIAEVIPMPHFSIVANKPDFWVGQYTWHGQELAIIDLEKMVENDINGAENANKLCIIYSINTDNAINAYAIPCFGAPQLIHLNESALKLLAQGDESIYLYCRTQIANKIAYIPNLDSLEKTICKTL